MVLSSIYRHHDRHILWGLLIISLIGVVALWVHSRHSQVRWSNVPPAPSETAAFAIGLGDTQMSYRFLGMTLQNFGNVSGRYERLVNYDYILLRSWFYLLDSLNPRSDFLPFLVTYYYGATSDKDQIHVIIDFLRDVGIREGGQKWKWLSQAVFLARYKLKNLDLAMEIAQELHNHPDQDVSAWARNLQSIILEKSGEKEAALHLTLSLLRENSDTMTQQEIFQLKRYICESLLNEEERPKFELCIMFDQRRKAQ